ncbi:hypothetical protein KAS08_02580 [Candidatus Pacearchaeota archaeon]|nr:hypothetical protein [Candidatus Pacearchaeota archaeon]
MVSDNFLDTNIIINYINYSEKSNNLVKNSHDYVLNSKGEIIVCEMVIKELNKIRERKSLIRKVVLELLKNENYDLSLVLSKKDIPFAKKLYARFRNYEIKKVSEIFIEEESVFAIEIDKFIETKVNKRVIPLSNIDNELVIILHDLITNIDDCKVLASALQYQKQQSEIFNFVTADNTDFNERDYKYLIEHFEINHNKKGFIFPKLVNLLSN